MIINSHQTYDIFTSCIQKCLIHHPKKHFLTILFTVEITTTEPALIGELHTMFLLNISYGSHSQTHCCLLWQLFQSWIYLFLTLQHIHSLKKILNTLPFSWQFIYQSFTDKINMKNEKLDQKIFYTLQHHLQHKFHFDYCYFLSHYIV